MKISRVDLDQPIDVRDGDIVEVCFYVVEIDGKAISADLITARAYVPPEPPALGVSVSDNLDLSDRLG